MLTRLPGTKPGVLDKRRQAVEERVQACGSSLARIETVAHDTAAVAAAIAGMAAEGLDPILVFGASAIVDRGDVIPAGLSAAGGEVIRLGMPVDPGNLLMLGRLGETGVLGVPSCASSLKVNGFDWVLERMLSGQKVGSQDIAAMAVGGLLMEIGTRPQPREARSAAPRTSPRIAAIVLAAGRSTRMGQRNKLLEDLGGMPIVRRVVAAALASRARPVVVVTGHEHERVATALSGLDIALAHNPRFAEGLSTSLAAGLDALPQEVDGALLMLGDMPRVSAAHIDRLIAAFAPKEGRAICLPVYEGRRGNPVLWGRDLFAEMRQVKGDTGARHLLGIHADVVAEVALDTDAILADVDTPEALAALRRTEA